MHFPLTFWRWLKLFLLCLTSFSEKKSVEFLFQCWYFLLPEVQFASFQICQIIFILSSYSHFLNQSLGFFFFIMHFRWGNVKSAYDKFNNGHFGKVLLVFVVNLMFVFLFGSTLLWTDICVNSNCGKSEGLNLDVLSKMTYTCCFVSYNTNLGLFLTS